MFRIIFVRMQLTREIRLRSYTSLLAFIVLLSFSPLLSQSSHREAAVENTYLFHFRKKSEGRDLKGEVYLLPYLFYTDPSGQVIDRLMDSFVLADQYFHYVPEKSSTGYDGMYKRYLLNSYLNDVFKQTRLPIVTRAADGRNKALLVNTKGSALGYTLNDIPHSDYLTISFDPEYEENSRLGKTHQILIGWEYLDENGNKIRADHLIKFSHSEWYDFYFKILTVHSDQRVEFQIPLPNELFSENLNLRFFIMNYDETPVNLLIDNIQLNAGYENLIPPADSDFHTEYEESTTLWEFWKAYNTRMNYYLFSGNFPLIDLFNSIGSSVSLPNTEKTGLILTFPDFNEKYYAHNRISDELYDEIEWFIDEAYQRYTDWLSAHPGPEVLISGFYIADEYFPEKKARKLEPLLRFVKEKLADYGWKLYASPYLMLNADGGIESTYSPTLYGIFDILWQQPNAFYNHFSRGNVDREYLRKVQAIIKSENWGINIESQIPEEGEFYPRINDYFTYAKKFGAVTKPKMFYDSGGSFYYFSKSTNPSERQTYDRLYDFIQTGRTGKIINGDFETYSYKTGLHGWDGEYSIKTQDLSRLLKKDFSITIPSEAEVLSEALPLPPRRAYDLNFSSSFEPQITLEFYSINQSVTVSPTIEREADGMYSAHFESPDFPSEMVVSFSNPFDRAISVYNFEIVSSENEERFRAYASSSNLIRFQNQEALSQGGNVLRLDFNQYAGSSMKIPVLSGSPYSLKFRAKADFSYFSDSKKANASVGIKTFNHFGSQIVSDIGKDFHYDRNRQALASTIEVSSQWETFEMELEFPEDIGFIQLFFYNEKYDNGILFDNVEFSSMNFPSLDNSFNLLNSNEWSDELPIYVTPGQPAFYKEFIEVQGPTEIEFSALIGQKENGSNLILNIEYFDQEKKPISLLDISNFSTAFQGPYLNTRIHFDDFESIVSEKTQITSQWQNTDWKSYRTRIRIPADVAFIRLSIEDIKPFHIAESVLLNPQILKITRKN